MCHVLYGYKTVIAPGTLSLKKTSSSQHMEKSCIVEIKQDKYNQTLVFLKYTIYFSK